MIMVTTMLLCSCNQEKDGLYGKRIEENLTSENILDDNYRNYYEIFVRSFNDSDGDKIGDLKGVTKKLDYIRGLGYTGIWLMPINPSTSYHKYNVDDYYSVDETYGTIDDLKELIEECHKRDIKLIIDLVLNHSGTNAPYFKKAINAYEKSLLGYTLTEEENEYKDFYSFFPSQADIPNGVTAYRASGKTFYYEANFDSGMPEFNCDSPYVLAEFKKIIKFYLDMGLDGFRLDAVKYYYYGKHTKNIEFLSKLNTYAKECNKDAYIVGECWDSYETIQNYYDSGCDSFFNFQTSVTTATSPVLNGTNREGAGLNNYYNGMISNYEIAKNGGIPAPFLDNHDMPRYTSTGNISISKYHYATLSMLNGSTFTYYGDEVGMVGSNASGLPDQNVRIPILWGDEENPDCSVISGVTTKSYPYGTVSEQMSKDDSIYNFYKKVLLIRNQFPEIARGSIELIEMDRDLVKELFISKEYNGSKIGIIYNFSPTVDLELDIKAKGFNEVVGQIVVEASSEKYIGYTGDGVVKMPPYSIAIVK